MLKESVKYIVAQEQKFPLILSTKHYVLHLLIHTNKLKAIYFQKAYGSN